MDLLKLAQGELDEGTELPTPDELLLELMDLTALAFPEPLSVVEVSFVKNEDGRRPALSDLNGVAVPGAPKRPDLGHTDNEVLDATNALLADFAEATLRQGGVKVLRGKIGIKDGKDGDKDVVLVDDDAAAEDAVVMTRRFDASELRWLFFTPQLFAALNRTEAAEDAADKAVAEALDGAKRFDIDMNKGVITFSADGRPPSPWRFELLGSFLDEKKRFLWGWANDAVDPRLTKGVNALREKSTGPGLRCFSDAGFGGPEKLFLRLVRHAAVEMGAVGVYRAPFAATKGKGVMYLALRSL